MLCGESCFTFNVNNYEPDSILILIKSEVYLSY